ncbi:MAG TPA: helix-turn-helix domain-containing protein [Cerasibacillus sp.]|uniref:helix-turn-helix domain-containing protein n=1 Tax=Cerasibacillus sp. TaxID=2498711 RepID=UPI002F3E8156
MEHSLLTTKEVAEYLNLSVQTIYKYIREKRLIPVYEDSWQIDETHLFKKEDVEALKAALTKPGFTTGEVAKQLQVHPTTVTSYIKRGELIAEKKPYKGRELYFITEEALAAFKEKHPMQRKRDKKNFYSKETNLYLYQKVIHKNQGNIGRIMELNGDEGKVWTEQGEIFPLEELYGRGFTAKEIKERPYMTKRGYVTFYFKKPIHIASPVFNVIELLYHKLSYRNIKLSHYDGLIKLEIKPCLLEDIHEDTHAYEIKLLEKHMKDGSIEQRHNGLLIDNDLEILTVHISGERKNKLKQLAQEQRLSLEQYVLKLIENRLNE